VEETTKVGQKFIYMLEQINQQIEVLVAFMKGKVLPLSFCWNDKKYSINKVNLVHSERIGRDKYYYFSVSAGEDYFKLQFNTENNKWLLAEAYYAS